MNYERLTQGRAYSGDPQFDNMSGRVVYQCAVEGITIDGWHVKRTVTYIDIGRCADVTPVDANVTIRDQGKDEDGNQRTTTMHAQRKTVELSKRVCALLAERPMTTRELAARLDVTVNRMKGFFISQPVGFVVLRRGRDGNLWGLAT